VGWHASPNACLGCRSPRRGVLKQLRGRLARRRRCRRGRLHRRRLVGGRRSLRSDDETRNAASLYSRPPVPRTRVPRSAALTYGGAELSASIFVRQMFKPSIMASSTPPTAAEREAARQPPRAASTPPVSAPDAIEFHGSSFRLSQTNVQSNVEKSPPHTAKLPANSGPHRGVRASSHWCEGHKIRRA
jgi:hypothetical protein